MRHTAPRAALTALLLLFCLPACEAEPEGSCAAIPVVAPSDRSLSIDADGRLRDSLGRSVVLRGINTGGRSKWAPFLPFPIDDGASTEAVRAAADSFFARLGPWGLDTVRLPWSWEALEPTRGTIDTAYLERYAAMVDAAHAAGLRVIIDLHQDVFASTWCGDGFPLWAVPKGAAQAQCPDGQWFLRYVFPEVRVAFARVYDNEDGLRDALAKAWTTMATRFADHPGVIGFELLNEPGGWTIGEVNDWKTKVLTPFHEALAPVVRKAAPNKLVFYDNPGYDALNTTKANHVRPAVDGLVYAPHYYDAGLIASKPYTGNAPRPYLEAVAAFAAKEKMPALLGEFGYGHASETQGGPAWLAETMGVIDELQLSATLWEYSVSSELWNEEDLSVVDAKGQERPILDTYVRPWVRAVAGTGARWSWDGERFTAEWTSDGGVTELILPSRLFGQGPKDLDAGGACTTWDAERGELRVKAPAGEKVSVSLRR